MSITETFAVFYLWASELPIFLQIPLGIFVFIVSIFTLFTLGVALILAFTILVKTYEGIIETIFETKWLGEIPANTTRKQKITAFLKTSALLKFLFVPVITVLLILLILYCA